MVRDIISELEIAQSEVGVIRDCVETLVNPDDLSRIDEAYFHLQEAIEILNQIEDDRVRTGCFLCDEPALRL